MKIQHTITAPTLIKLAAALECSPNWLAYGEGSKTDHADLIERPEPLVSLQPHSRRARLTRLDGHVPASNLKVTEKIAAGNWFEGERKAPVIDAEVPSDPRAPAAQQIAVLIDDDSINKIAFPGEILVVDTKRTPAANDVVLISRNRGDLREVTARRYVPSEDAIELRCDTSNPNYQGSITVKKNMRAEDGSVIKIEGVAIYAYRPIA